MKIKRMMIIAVMIFLAGGLYAQQGQGPHGNKNKQNCSGQCKNISDLTDAQKEKIKGFRTAHLKEMTPLKNQLNEKRAHLKTISTGDKVDVNKVYATIDEIGKLKADIQKKQFKHRQEIRNVLTDEQKVIFDMRAGRGKGQHQGGKFHQGRGQYRR